MLNEICTKPDFDIYHSDNSSSSNVLIYILCELENEEFLGIRSLIEQAISRMYKSKGKQVETKDRKEIISLLLGEIEKMQLELYFETLYSSSMLLSLNIPDSTFDQYKAAFRFLHSLKEEI